jgi:bacitracin transport system permease protein
MGAFVTPFMVFAGVLKNRLDSPGEIVTYEDMLRECSLYTMILFGLMVYTVIASYLFSREYTENTLKTILAVPVSKVSFMIGKCFILFLWIITLTVISFFATILFGIIVKATGFNGAVFISYFMEYIADALFLFITISPFIMITLWFKNFVVPVIAVTSVAMINCVVFNENWGALFPWSASYLIVSGEWKQYGYPFEISLIPIITIAVIGFAVSVIYFRNEDIN